MELEGKVYMVINLMMKYFLLNMKDEVYYQWQILGLIPMEVNSLLILLLRLIWMENMLSLEK